MVEGKPYGEHFCLDSGGRRNRRLALRASAQLGWWASEILKLLAAGPLSEWIRNLPAGEEREQYDTADEPRVDVSQSQAGVNELPAKGASNLLAQAQAAAIMQRGMAGGSRQQSAQQMLAGANATANPLSPGGRCGAAWPKHSRHSYLVRWLC